MEREIKVRKRRSSCAEEAGWEKGEGKVEVVQLVQKDSQSGLGSGWPKTRD